MEIKEAILDLLEDCNRGGHKCNDKNCPIERAAKALGILNRLIKQTSKRGKNV